MKISPSIKGLVTAVLMITVILSVYYAGETANRNIQYLVYILYALGITWTIFAYRQSLSFTGKFKDLFSQGFKCFIVVTFIISIFYGWFNYLHPEFAEQTANAYRESLIKGNQTLPADIETEVATFKKQYTLKLVSGAIFGYLIIGAVVTAILSSILTRRK